MGDVDCMADTRSALDSLRKPVRPDASGVRTQTQRLTETIEKYALRIQEIKEKTAQRKGKRTEPSPQERGLQESLYKAQNEFQKAWRKKQSIRNALNKANEVRESARVKVRQIKENSRVSSIEEIDSQIKRLEEKVNSSELTEKEEEKCIESIRQLVRSRETLRSLRKQLDAMQSQENPCENLMDQLKEIDSKMDECSAQEKELKKQLEAIQKKREEDDMEVLALNAEKEECWQVLCALRQKRKEINDAFTEEMSHYRLKVDEYHTTRKELERKLAAELKAQKKEEMEARRVIERPVPKKAPRAETRSSVIQENIAKQEEKEKKRTEQRRQRQREMQQSFCQEKVDQCADLLSYLALLLPVAKEEGSVGLQEATPSVSQSWSPSEAGMKPLKKGDIERDAWMMGGKGKKSKHKKPKKPGKMEKPEDRFLMHSLSTLRAFSDLKVAPPDTLADVSKAVERLEEVKQYYEAKKADPDFSPRQKHSPESTEPREAQDGNSCPSEEPSRDVTAHSQQISALPEVHEGAITEESPFLPQKTVRCIFTVKGDREICMELNCMDQ